MTHRSVAAATIESLAESLVDSWLPAYSLFGLDAAYPYCAANTADAM